MVGYEKLGPSVLIGLGLLYYMIASEDPNKNRSRACFGYMTLWKSRLSFIVYEIRNVGK